MTLTDRQRRQCEQSRWDFSDLDAVFINCTLNGRPFRRRSWTATSS
jgi:hypothetical protein